MKIKNQKNVSFASGYAIIPRGDNIKPLRLLVTALSPLFEFNIDKYIPTPQPPADYAKSRGTNKLVRDGAGNPVLIKRKDDPEYQRKLSERVLYISTWTTYEALRKDDNVEWENQKPEKLTQNSVTEWLEKLLEEIVESGFTMGDMRIILDKCAKLGNNIDELVQEQAESFLFEERELGIINDGSQIKSQEEAFNT